MKAKPDRARLIAPPPLLVLACIGIGFAADHFTPIPLFSSGRAFQIGFGILLIVCSIAIIASARRVFVAHGTHPNPYRPTTAVVVTGIYRFSRNPIYIAFLLVLAAFGLFANSFWFILLVPVLWLFLDFGIVRREEAYLLEKFGDSYREYRNRVRRWI